MMIVTTVNLTILTRRAIEHSKRQKGNLLLLAFVSEKKISNPSFYYYLTYCFCLNSIELNKFQLYCYANAVHSRQLPLPHC